MPIQCSCRTQEHHSLREENLSAELHQVRRLLQRKKQQGHAVKSPQDFLHLLRPYKEAFMDLFKLISISLTLPVTSVSCERSFSCLRRLKNDVRNSSGDTRTSNLGLLAINSMTCCYGTHWNTHVLPTQVT
uniref:HAT C-terminal dimerisation domain-containing protein n=1 Tax=Neogobius melanostomus TaxID=47308 RepID=A0A8C6SZ64_9GOBI